MSHVGGETLAEGHQRPLCERGQVDSYALVLLSGLPRPFGGPQKSQEHSGKSGWGQPLLLT